jgi:AraC-like DNA-binding protein
MVLTSESAPLARHALVDTRCPEEARERIGRIFCPHFLVPREARPRGFHARHNSAPQADYSVNFVAYGAEVEIDPGELAHFFLLQWPVRGGAEVRSGSQSVEAAAGERASLLSPTLPTRMFWREGCEKVIALIRREAMLRQFEALTGRPTKAIEFEAAIAMGAPVGRQIRGHLELMTAAAENGAPTPYQALLRDALTTLLLTGLVHNHSNAFAGAFGEAAPRAVRRAEAYIDAHISDPIAMEDVARAAGANLRSLQNAYRKTFGATLTETIQGKRLELFRRRLGDPAAPASITEIAYSAGLAHLGRAAAAYRQRYGETPRETMRRR